MWSGCSGRLMFAAALSGDCNAVVRFLAQKLETYRHQFFDAVPQVSASRLARTLLRAPE